MTNMQPIPQVPGENDERDDVDTVTTNDVNRDADTDADAMDRPLDPDVNQDEVDSAAADVQAATEGTLPSSDR